MGERKTVERSERILLACRREARGFCIFDRGEESLSGKGNQESEMEISEIVGGLQRKEKTAMQDYKASEVKICFKSRLLGSFPERK
jgi:hypothetical protein